MSNLLPKLLIGRREKLNLLDLELPGGGQPIQIRIEPEAKVRLGAIDPNWHGSYDSLEAAQQQLRYLSCRLDYLQNLMYAEKKHSLLLVFQGLDASGKNGAIRHLLAAMNVAGCRVVDFKRPRREEREHDFLWRIHPHLPGKGEVSIFNRSHYEDVLVVRVHQAGAEDFWSRRYALINDFEKLTVVENKTTILKFFLHISKQEQLARFKQRLEDPTRQWKISIADYEERNYWDDYIRAFEETMQRTSTLYAPWFVIPSNQKWFRDLAISEIVVRTLEEMNMKWPEPSVDLADIRRRYHSAETEDGTV